MVKILTENPDFLAGKKTEEFSKILKQIPEILLSTHRSLRDLLSEIEGIGLKIEKNYKAEYLSMSRVKKALSSFSYTYGKKGRRSVPPKKVIARLDEILGSDSTIRPTFSDDKFAEIVSRYG